MFIVSLKSFGERLIKESPLAVESILNNTILPDKICIIIDNVDKDNVPELFNNHELIEVIYSDCDIKAHGKYYYTMLKYPNDVIITIDDDVIYPDTFIEDCINAYNSFPEVINASRVHKIKYTSYLFPYRLWEWESKETGPSYDLFFTGVGGVVYPPNIFNKEDLNLSVIKEYLFADDILLNYLCRKHRIKVRRFNMQKENIDINIVKNKIKLSTLNIILRNDSYLKKIKFFNLIKECNK